MMRLLSSLSVVVALLGALPVEAQRNVPPPPAKAYATAPEIPFRAELNFLKLPADLYMGEGIGVARNSKDHVFVYTRSGESSRLFEFDPSGTFLREIGRGLYGFSMAHAVRVDSEDNIWAVDEGTDMVIKFNPRGRVTMLLGRRPESHGLDATPPRGTPPPAAQPYRFGRPTDIAWDAEGNIFISDGYTNSRVVKYDKNGRFVRSVGSRGSEPSQLNTPHSIQTDRNGNVYVGDRGNRRIQVFSNDLDAPGDLRHRGRALGALHHSRTASVPVQLELESGQQQLEIQRGHGRDLQDGARRDRSREIRPRRKTAR